MARRTHSDHLNRAQLGYLLDGIDWEPTLSPPNSCASAPWSDRPRSSWPCRCHAEYFVLHGTICAAQIILTFIGRQRQPSRIGKKSVTVYLPENIWRELRILAATTDTTMDALMRRGVNLVLTEHKATKRGGTNVAPAD
jgi:hypothetical protein